jgi:hypothetical protein
MTGKRASVFENGEDGELDLSTFKPTVGERTGPLPEQVRAISEAVKFPSREARISKPSPVTEQKIGQRRYRTGRNMPITIKAKPEHVQGFNAICDKQNWVQGYTFERALAALERELAKS